MRMRKKPNLTARMDRCRHLLVENPQDFRGNWQSIQPTAQEIWLELGAGKGTFTVKTAQNHPETLYIALERVPDAMIVAMEKALELGLTNVRFIDGDAADLAAFFALEEISRLYVNFCDPWPGHKHARRRLIHANFLTLYRKVLKIGGEIHFKTDNKDLFEFSLFQFPKVGYALSQVSRNLHQEGVQGVMTDYEAKFHQQGLPIHRCVGTKEALDQEPEFIPIFTGPPEIVQVNTSP